MLLYERWLQVAGARGDAFAVRDLAAGRTWTFRELASEAERGSPAGTSFIFAQGAGAEFILSTLVAWRNSAVLCPVEPGQTPPEFSTRPPAGVVHLKTTSASTGAPRYIAFKPEQLAADAENIIATMGLRPDWPNVGVISLAHSYGFSNLVLPLLLHGIPLVLAGSVLPEAVRGAAAQLPACTLAGVPALWRTWHEAGAIPTNIQLAVSAGAPLPVALEQSVFAELGLKIHNFYGSSECGGIAYDRTLDPRTDSACAGTAVTGVDVSIATEGCVQVGGAAVGESYWPEPDARLGNGLFRTSDQGELREGQVYLLGRATDLINVAGRKVSPEAIERVLAACPEVRACVVFGVPTTDLGRGEQIVACVSLTPGPTLAAVKRFATERLPAWQLPRDWWAVDELAHNVRGKISRAEWKDRYLRKAIKLR